jgi:hypothetical protein
MKNQKAPFLRSLAVLPSLDFFNPEPGIDPSTSVGGGASTTNSFDHVDVKLISPNTGNESNYAELHLQSRIDGGTTPIIVDTDTDRAILFMPVPQPNSTWRMSLLLSNETMSDTVQIQGIEGKYDILRTQAIDNRSMLLEDEGIFFTVSTPEAMFETYVNVNQTNEVIRLSYSNFDVFDAFRVSLIGKCNAAR